MKKSSKRTLIFSIIIIISLALLTFIFVRIKQERYNSNLTPKSQIVTKEMLLNDIKKIQNQVGVDSFAGIFDNTINLKYSPERVFKDEKGNIIDGKVINAAIRNKVFSDSKAPNEVRFFMRIMLYLCERKLSPNIGNLIGITAGFSRNYLQFPDGEVSQPIYISITEFQALYKEANVENLDLEKQLDILTNLWIKKTGYWRRGLYGIEEKPLTK